MIIITIGTSPIDRVENLASGSRVLKKINGRTVNRPTKKITTGLVKYILMNSGNIFWTIGKAISLVIIRYVTQLPNPLNTNAKASKNHPRFPIVVLVFSPKSKLDNLYPLFTRDTKEKYVNSPTSRIRNMPKKNPA
ncbi:hypothetical protein AYI68_g5645 [Smittium mucronatum]|uniref:Uncharacterized protein n=1 Tax=Smittium mucronatum TaxID=133383 RepID=A0A1R0GTQ6_9FUNG|nr:hypothetical protein AYI68_g5645 [Smittium mucronatum]